MRFVEFICSFAGDDDPVSGDPKWDDGKITLDLDAVFAFNETNREGLTAVRTHHEVFMLKIAYEEFKKIFHYKLTNAN